ncbi:MAG TPA: hypothetical protein VLX91_03650 [Candidatus Acidoferrales bacterium]|nr:hypothetical protein [Candidatus Acidoferrales bacterium]
MKNSLFALVLVFGAAALLLYRHFIPDDAFIHIGYAKDILSGKGYSFAGNKTYGSTAPLWPLLIAATAFILHNFVASARLLSLGFAAASIVMMYYTAKLRFGSIESSIAAFLLAANAYFLRWSFTGMEAPAACFFMLLLAFIVYKENDGTSKRSVYLPLGLAPLIRPEFCLVFLIFFSYLLAEQKTKFDFVKIILSALPLLCWLTFAIAYYGTIVPTTLLSKAGDPFFSTEIYTLLRDAKLLLSENLVEIGFILVAVTMFLLPTRNPKLITTKRINSETFLFMILTFSFFCFYMLKNVAIISRYSLMITPLVILVTVDFVGRVIQRWNFSTGTKRFAWVALIAGSAFYNSLFTAFIVKPDADRFYEGFQKHYTEIAELLNKLNTGNCHVATPDVGIIGVYSGCGIYDLGGLVDKDWYNYNKSTEEYLKAKKPEFIILRTGVHVRLPDLDVSLQKIYDATLAGFGINATQDTHVEVYRAHWQ